MAGLINALKPTHLQKITNNSPYFVGMTEREWLNMMEDVRDDMINARGFNAARDIAMSDMNIGYSEATKVAEDARKRGRMRHVDIAVPHAYVGENLLARALDANNDGRRARLLNQGDNQFATDLELMLGDITKLVDVQTHLNPNVLSLGVMSRAGKGRNGGAMQAWDNASDNDTLLNIASRIDRAGGLRDKLMQSRKVAEAGIISPDMAKDMLITSHTRGGSNLNNLGGVPIRKGTYNVRKPDTVSVIDLDKVRPELLNMTKRQLIKDEINLNRMSAELDGKLTLRVPMDKLREIGDKTGEYLDPEVLAELTGVPF